MLQKKPSLVTPESLILTLDVSSIRLSTYSYCIILFYFTETCTAYIWYSNFSHLIGERWQFAYMPYTPTKNATCWKEATCFPYYGMGAIGYATSGGVFFDTRSSTDGDTAFDNEIRTLDTCMGHSNAALQYHYHGVIIKTLLNSMLFYLYIYKKWS